MTTETAKTLEQQIDQLIYQCRLLEKENRSLRAQEDSWKKERTRLVEKNEIARSRVETMIQRLKAMEHEA